MKKKTHLTSVCNEENVLPQNLQAITICEKHQ